MHNATPVTFGAAVRLKHVGSGKFLKALPDLYGDPSKTASPRQQVVIAAEEENASCDWLVEAPYDMRTPTGTPVLSGSEIRLLHLSTRAHLHSHNTSKDKVPTPAYKGMQEVTAYISTDTNDNWSVEVIGGGPWLAESQVRFRHTRSRKSTEGDILYSHPDGVDKSYFYGHQGVVCAFHENDSSAWTCSNVMSNQEYVSALISNAKAAGSTSLDLHGFHINVFPTPVLTMSLLERLNSQRQQSQHNPT